MHTTHKGCLDELNPQSRLFSHCVFMRPLSFKMRKLKTTSEPLETTESALEMQAQQQSLQAGGNTIILNPALHSAAATLAASAAGGNGQQACPHGQPTSSGRLGRSSSRQASVSKKPPALILTKDSVTSSQAGAPQSGGSSAGRFGSHDGGQSPGWKVTFPDIEIHSPREIQPDNASISSRGTSSTVGYR